jgi:hypothetical protein
MEQIHAWRYRDADRRRVGGGRDPAGSTSSKNATATTSRTRTWRKLYASRSGAEGTIAEFTGGHRARHCRYRGPAKAHVQHVLTAIAVNIQRLSGQEPADSDYRPRPPTALQQYLDAHDLPRPIWWRQGE